MSFVTRALKVSVILLWVCSGTVGMLAARNFERKLDAAVAELSVVRKDAESKLLAANEELAALQQQQAMTLDDLVHSQELRETAIEAALKWRSKFEAICHQVHSLSVDATAFTE